MNCSTVALIVLALSVAVYSLTETAYRSAFEDFKIQFDKSYGQHEEEYRYNVFKSNLDFVNNWDAEARGFTVKINKFADLSSKEFSSIYNGMNITRTYKNVVHTKPTVSVKDSVLIDWRQKGAVTGVKYQGSCGSCWSFSATGSTEGAWVIAKGLLISLSEQNLVDCSSSQGNQGCNGGLMDQAFQYIISNNGIDTEDSYPYSATGPNNCQFNSANVGATLSSYIDVDSGNESALLSTLYQGPVSVAVDASLSSFQLYAGGVYYEPSCSSTSLDHGVLVVGAGTDDSGNDYWIVKNSYGTDWGMTGYINMSRNKDNNCGIATAASIPVV